MSAGFFSMTGYGSSAATIEGWRLSVTCRSVNHRALSVRTNVPEELRWLEPAMTKRLKSYVSRGRVELRVELEPDADTESDEFGYIDEARFSAVARELKRLAIEHRLRTPVSLDEIWEFRFYFERSRRDVFSEDSREKLMPVVDQAIEEMVESRRAEGEGIRVDLKAHLQELKARIDDVEELKEKNEPAYRSRIETRLRQTLEEFELGGVSEGRLAQEVAHYVDRGDISEELQRGRSHVEKLGAVIEQNAEDGIGKKIDFYLQELIRETNTMGSKSQDAGLTGIVIDMKSLVEKMREQAANVE